MSLQRYYDRNAPSCIIALNSEREYEKEVKQSLYPSFIPHKVLIWQTDDVELEELLPNIKEKHAENDKTTLYICYEGMCQAPVHELSEIVAAIKSL